MGLLLLGIPKLLLGSVHVKNEVCLLEVFIVKLFNRTLSINDVKQRGEEGGKAFCDTRA